MTNIKLETIINAPIDICFDLSRSIDLHQFTTRETKERAVAGRTSGLIEKDESVTWEATHFFLKQRLTSKIVEMSRPHNFTDTMTKGIFKSMWHQHSFIKINNETKMIDDFKYEAPFGILGRIFNTLLLKKHLTNLLIERNTIIKNVAESRDYNNYLI